MTVLVTGGAGFIGSHLVDALLRRGHRVRVLDNLSAGRMENLKGNLSKIRFIRGDLRREADVRKAVRGIRVIYHQAAMRSVPKSVDNPEGFHDVNVTGTFRLLRLAHQAGVKRVVFASSSSVYGNRTRLPQKETFQAAPESPYAASKLAGEVYCQMFTRLFGLETACLRYFNVFGPRQSLESKYAVAVPMFIACLMRGLPPPVHGDGKQTRDFTFVENVIQANLKAGAAPRASGEVFNVASGTRYSVLDLARLLQKRIGTRLKPNFEPTRTGDVRDTWADISKIRRLAGYRVEVPFEQGLDRTVDWFLKHPPKV